VRRTCHGALTIALAPILPREAEAGYMHQTVETRSRSS
jgi:hypothetical protein